ncbi:MAG TPA: pantoate--beta-alanine ligase [Fibrobacteria bacterium]|nr:pantoate--beta-alanine ligase [Fibrobacteria bacterium]HOX52072.1 pantoate--beta-alanine ligase [Fibrobacteria bacterium]
MQIFHTANQMRAWSRDMRRAGRRVGFVPTMGALHSGHASLLDEAGRRADTVVLSIFVNPTQFGPNEDFAKYPRTWDADLKLARDHGVQAIFHPSEDFYPKGYRTQVTVPGWKSVLEGEIRPDHFDGVTSVVTKLFHSVDPDVAVFGQKDAQQALLVRRMIRDLDFGLELVVAPTVRESDGLALSSRNRYLSESDRRRALVLSRALAASVALWDAGCRNPSELVAAGRTLLSQDPPDLLDYFTLLDPDSLEVLDSHERREDPCILVVAGRYGTTRLIDNAVLGAVW